MKDGEQEVKQLGQMLTATSKNDVDRIKTITKRLDAVYSGMAFEEIQKVADKMLSREDLPVCSMDSLLRKILILIANLAARMKEIQQHKI